jgi:hypothetical protein
MTNEKTISIELTRTEANALMVMLDSEMEGCFGFDSLDLNEWENLDLASYKILAFHKYKTWYMENCGE